MLRYINWCGKRGYDAFPLEEERCYEFALDSDHAAPTFLRSFLVSVTFGHFILGITGSADCMTMSSTRLQGIASQSFLRKRKRRQRQPLTADQVRKMELFVAGEIPGKDGDKLATWFFLLCVYMRARYSDGLNLAKLVLDCPAPEKRPIYGFLEGVVSRSKTSYTTEKKTMNLPMVALRRGLTGRDWISHGLMLREALPFAIYSGVPLLPAPTHSGWQQSPLTACQAGLWLRGILAGLGEEPSSLVNVGTTLLQEHLLELVCKGRSAFGGTTPPWLSLGWWRQNDTLLFSRRRECQDPLMIFRESLMMWLREHCNLTILGQDIVSLTVLSKKTTVLCLLLTRKNQVAIDLEVDSTDSEDSADDEDQDLDGDLDWEAENEVVPAWSQLDREVFEAFIRDGLARHRFSSMFHLVADEGGAHLKCGKTINNNYDLVKDEPKFVYPMCSVCFR